MDDFRSKWRNIEQNHHQIIIIWICFWVFVKFNQFTTIVRQQCCQRSCLWGGNYKYKKMDWTLHSPNSSLHWANPIWERCWWKTKVDWFNFWAPELNTRTDCELLSLILGLIVLWWAGLPMGKYFLPIIFVSQGDLEQRLPSLLSFGTDEVAGKTESCACLILREDAQ